MTQGMLPPPENILQCSAAVHVHRYCELVSLDGMDVGRVKSTDISNDES